MSLDAPTTRLTLSIASAPPSPPTAASSLFDQTLSEARTRLAKRDKKDLKGKGKASHVTEGSMRRTRKHRIREEEEDETVLVEVDSPPTYETAICEPEPNRTRRRRTRRERTSSISSRSNNSGSAVSSASSSRSNRSEVSSQDENKEEEEEEDALSNLLNLTDSLLTSSSEILSASKALHTQLSQFLLSSSPPSQSHCSSSSSTRLETNMLMNDVRSEIGLNGDNWDRLNRLERDVERFGMKKDGKDPRSQLLLGRRSSGGLSQAVVGGVQKGMGVVEEEGEDGSDQREDRESKLVGLGRPSTGPVVGSSSTAIESSSVLAAKSAATRGHLRRSSTAKDLLIQISSSTTSTPSTPISTSSPFRSSSAPLSRPPSTLQRTLDSPFPAPHRLSISPSLPSLSSSSSMSTSLSSSSIPTLVSPPPPDRPRDVPSTTPTKSGPVRGLSISPSPSTLSLSIGQSDISTSPVIPASESNSRRSSALQHRRTSTISKTDSIVKLDEEENPLRVSDSPESSRIAGTVAGGGGGALDRLRNLQGPTKGTVETKNEGGSGGGGSWWGWR
ncbi:hypothetical protein JCM16303_001550 [Sporobolomyces ruberrimus]